MCLRDKRTRNKTSVDITSHERTHHCPAHVTYPSMRTPEHARSHARARTQRKPLTHAHLCVRARARARRCMQPTKECGDLKCPDGVPVAPPHFRRSCNQEETISCSTFQSPDGDRALANWQVHTQRKCHNVPSVRANQHKNRFSKRCSMSRAPCAHLARCSLIPHCNALSPHE